MSARLVLVLVMTENDTWSRVSVYRVFTSPLNSYVGIRHLPRFVGFHRAVRLSRLFRSVHSVLFFASAFSRRPFFFLRRWVSFSIL